MAQAEGGIGGYAGDFVGSSDGGGVNVKQQGDWTILRYRTPEKVWDRRPRAPWAMGSWRALIPNIS